jgi:4-amino-4-deoxychorismate lyase
VQLRVCDARLGLNPTLAGIKHLGRLEQVLARSEWDEPAIAEGLMLDTEGRVVEGTMTNLFLRNGDRLYTPELGACGTAGVVRGLVMDLAEDAGLTLNVTHLFLKDVFDADAAFLTNSVIGFWPVKRLQDRDLEVPAIPPAFSESLLAKVYSE